MVTEDTADIIYGKAPMDFGDSSVTRVFPGDDFQRQRPLIRQAPLETLARENTQLNLVHRLY
jgi:hypothetical protein